MRTLLRNKRNKEPMVVEHHGMTAKKLRHCIDVLDKLLDTMLLSEEEILSVQVAETAIYEDMLTLEGREKK